MKRFSVPFAAAVILTVLVSTMVGLAQTAGTSATPSAKDQEAVQRHLAAAREAAGYEVSDLYDHLCSRLLVGANLPYGRIIRPDNDRTPAKFRMEPVKVFDNLYYLGEKMQHGASPSAWALTTPEGIILIDTMFEDSVEEQIEGGLKKMNLNPADIKYAIITHGHSDHLNGAKFLQDKYNVKIVMSAQDWDLVENNQNYRGPKPRRDMVATDGQKLTLGGQTVTLYVTPGHTPGTVSMLIPAKDGGASHLAALWGGTGFQFSPAEYNKQALRFRDIVTRAGADIMLSTHPQLDKSDIKLPLVAKRKLGEPHPYVVGKDIVVSYLTVAAECSAVAVLRPDLYNGYMGR